MRGRQSERLRTRRASARSLPGDGRPWPAIARTIWRMAPRPEVGSPKSDPTKLSMRPASHNTPNRLPSTTSPRPSRSPHRTTSRNGRCRMVCASTTSVGARSSVLRPPDRRRSPPVLRTRDRAAPGTRPARRRASWLHLRSRRRFRCGRRRRRARDAAGSGRRRRSGCAAYGMCRSLRKMNPVRTTSSASSNR